MSMGVVVSPVTRVPASSCQSGSYPADGCGTRLAQGVNQPFTGRLAVLSRALVVRTGMFLLTVAGAAACGNSSGPLAPYQPQINNVTDNFQFQATGVSTVTWTYTYQWLNTGDSATVNQSTNVSSGSATLTISDSTGAQLYSQSLSANGTFGMTKGIHGHWTVKVQFTNYSGTVNFRVQKQ